MDSIRILWAYRGFVIGSVKREFQNRYKNSMLGAAWIVLQPLSMIIVYTVIFAKFISAKLPGVESSFGYSIYLCAGLLTWGLFSEVIGRCQNTFIENSNLLKKISFPRLCLPAIVIASTLLNFSIIFGLFLVFLILSGNFPGWPFLAVIPILTIQMAFAVGLGISIGVLNVFFRDVGHIFNIIIQFWFWLTPIVYPVTILPEWVRKLMIFNPMAGIIGSYQIIFVNGEWPDWLNLIPVLVLAMFFCTSAFYLVRRKSGEMVDEL